MNKFVNKKDLSTCYLMKNALNVFGSAIASPCDVLIWTN